MAAESDGQWAGELDAGAFGLVDAAAAGFEHVPFIMVVGDGPALRAVAFNAAARAFTQDRYVVGTPFDELFPREVLGQGWSDWYRTPLATGETVTVTESRMQLQQPDGTSVDVYLDAAFAPRLGPDGQPRGTVVFAQDVTARVLARQAVERELEELRERYAAIRGGVRAMQRALLPDAVPLLPGADIAARYLLSSDEAAAGGDWFDAVTGPDGATFLVVGDVVGHGQRAAVAMGQLRSVLLSQLRAGAGVAAAVRFLDGFAQTVPAARRATVAVVRVDGDGAVQYCTAGHPPPLVVGGDPDGDRYLPASGAGPLATGNGFDVAETHLAVGESVVLYTDGILERPGTTAAAAGVELLRTAGAAARNELMPVGAPRSAAERICTLSLELLTRRHGYVDDITIAALHRRTPLPDLDVELAVGRGALTAGRAALSDWLEQADAEASDLQPLLHAVTELIANVLDHAHLDGQPSPFHLRARLGQDGRAVVEVADRGNWKLPILTSQRGRGLALIRQLVDELQLDRPPHGTTARLLHPMRRSAGLLPTPGAAPRVGSEQYRNREEFIIWATDGPQPTLTVLGPLDSEHTTELGAHLQLAITEAAAAITVDLSGLTLLASAGVDLLFTTVDQARAAGIEVNLQAANGSPAQQVLDLVRLPHQ